MNLMFYIRTKRGHIPKLTISGAAYGVGTQTQRHKVITQDGMKLKLSN